MEDPQKVTVAQACGESFARAIAGKDAGALCAVLAETIDFQALTPRRHWQASANTEVAIEIILGTWFADARIDELCAFSSGQVARRARRLPAESA